MTILTLPLAQQSVTHPDVLYTPDGWAGYKYWMACTPYPEGVEDPCILASDDGLSWVIPQGLVNPIAGHESGSYNSDPDIIMCPDGSMHCLFRNAISLAQETIYLTKSTDGVIWSDKVPMFHTTVWPSIMSPAVVYHDGKYCLYTVDAHADPPELVMRFSEDLYGTWELGQPMKFSLPRGTLWHIDVSKDDLGWFCLAVVNGAPGLYYGTSEDGMNWTMNDNPVVPAREDVGIYRASGIRADGMLSIWYGTYNQNNLADCHLEHIVTAIPRSVA